MFSIECIQWLKLYLGWAHCFLCPTPLHLNLRACHSLQLLYHLPVAMGLFSPLGCNPWEGMQCRDNSRHPIKVVLDSQFLKVLPCDSLINQAPYLNLAGSKSNKLRLSEKNIPSRHPHVLTKAHTCTHSLFQSLPVSEHCTTVPHV